MYSFKALKRSWGCSVIGYKTQTSFQIIWHSELNKKIFAKSDHNRFEDFHKTNEMEFPIFNNPFNFEALQAPVHFQMESIDLQSDSILKKKKR